MIFSGRTALSWMGATLFIGGCVSTSLSPEPLEVKTATGATSSLAPLRPIPAKAVDDSDATLLCYRLSHPEKGGFLQPRSFVTSWYMYGPFLFTLGAEEEAQMVHHPFMQEERLLSLDGKPARLVDASGDDPMGSVNLTKVFGNACNHSAIYAVTCIYADQEMNNLTLYAGSDDYIKVWINGVLVHTYNRNGRSGKWDQDVVPGIKLRAGANLIVVKSINLVDQWMFFFRLADSNGEPLEFIPARQPREDISLLISQLREEGE